MSGSFPLSFSFLLCQVELVSHVEPLPAWVFSSAILCASGACEPRWWAPGSKLMSCLLRAFAAYLMLSAWGQPEAERGRAVSWWDAGLQEGLEVRAVHSGHGESGRDCNAYIQRADTQFRAWECFMTQNWVTDPSFFLWKKERLYSQNFLLDFYFE